jgi:peptidoglycan/LPS O-acetylase OafA/YrhL
VFFVLSGFLITRIILREQHSGRFSFAAFYLRRARRLLPALLTVLATTLGLGLVCLTPLELRDLAASTASAVLSASNIHYWLSTGYFESSSVMAPLLMTWSLGVEAQFYLLYPLLLIGAARLGLRLEHVLLVSLVAGFVLACVALTVSEAASFYLLPMRAWELLLGAYLASRSWRRLSASMQDRLAALGIALVLASFALLDAHSKFPAWGALAPCVGTALLIVAQRSWLSTRLLSSSALVGLGLISYSLYLWHWPLLSFARILWGPVLPGVTVATILAIAATLACVTYRLIEEPARRTRVPAAISAQRYVALSAALLVAALGLQHAGGVAERLDDEGRMLYAAARPDLTRDESAKLWRTEVLAPLPGRCLAMAGEPALDSNCEIPARAGSTTAFVWGDSHAAHYLPAVKEFVRQGGHGLRVATMAGCRPYKSRGKQFQEPAKQACESRNRAALDLIVARKDYDPIILGGRWSHYASGTRNRPARFHGEMQTLIEEFHRLGRTVIVLGEVPLFAQSPIECRLRSHLPIGPVSVCSTEFEALDREQAVTREILRRVATSAARPVCVLDPRLHLCPSGRCDQMLPSGAAAYWDDNHLSSEGARWLGAREPFQQCIAT